MSSKEVGRWEWGCVGRGRNYRNYLVAQVVAPAVFEIATSSLAKF